MRKFLLMLVCVLNITVIQGSTSFEACGIIEAAKQTRVVNGEESSEAQWPWMALVNVIKNRKYMYCGGSLIGKRHILTYAQCVESVHPSLINVTLGNHNVLEDGEQYRVARVRVHPGFNLSYSDKILDIINDVAVLTLDRDVKRSKYVIPICLPDDYLSNETFYDWKAYVAGWGRTEYNGKLNEILRWANVTIWKNDDCRETYKTVLQIHDNDICAGGVINQGRNICYGDYGGPLIVFNNGKWKVIGIAKGSLRCGSEGHPAIFTRVNKYLNWIKNRMS